MRNYSTLDPSCPWVADGPPCLPEERLRLAVFQRAVLDLLPPTAGGVCVEARDRSSARTYLLEPVHQEWVFSLSAVAEQLGTTPESLRRRVRALLESPEGQESLMRRMRYSRVGSMSHLGRRGAERELGPA